MVTTHARSNPKDTPTIEGNRIRNALLLGLPSQESALAFPQLTFVQLRINDILQEAGETIKYAYFVDSGLISILSIMQDGKSVEVGISGREGCTGLPLAVGFTTSDTRALVQVAGAAFRLTSQNLAKALRKCPVLKVRMLQYAQMMAMQATQIAACNRLHGVDERLARWLLMSQDRIGGDIIPLTHEFLAHMLGTRRSSVTVAAGLLANEGLITYSRGYVKIESREQLQDATCECYALLRRHTEMWKKEMI